MFVEPICSCLRLFFFFPILSFWTFLFFLGGRRRVDDNYENGFQELSTG